MLLWGYAFMLHLLAREMHAAAGMTAAEAAQILLASCLAAYPPLSTSMHPSTLSIYAAGQ